MQQQTQEPINFNVNYHGGIIASIRVRQYDTKEKTVMARERVGHPPAGGFGYVGFPGPNSNTYVSHQLKRAGCEVPSIKDAPGLSFNPRTW